MSWRMPPAALPSSLSSIISIMLLLSVQIRRAVSWCVATTSLSSQVSRPDTVLLSMGHHDCDTQTTPKTLVHPYPAIENHEPTLRSSKNRGEGPTIVQGRRVGKREAVRHRYKLPTPSRPIHPRSEDS